MIVKTMLIHAMDLTFFSKHCRFYHYAIYVFTYYYPLNCLLHTHSIYLMIDGKLILFAGNSNISDEHIPTFGVTCIYCCHNHFV